MNNYPQLNLFEIKPKNCSCLKLHALCSTDLYVTAKCRHGFYPDHRRISRVAMRKLTHSEKKVVVQMFNGLNNTQIAKAIGIKTKTAKNHICNIYKKFDVHDRFELADKISEPI